MPLTYLYYIQHCLITRLHLNPCSFWWVDPDHPLSMYIFIQPHTSRSYRYTNVLCVIQLLFFIRVVQLSISTWCIYYFTSGKFEYMDRVVVCRRSDLSCGLPWSSTLQKIKILFPSSLSSNDPDDHHFKVQNNNIIT